MESREKDWLKRQIAELSRVLVALVLRARQGSSYESGLEAVREIGRRHLPVPPELLERLDPASVRSVLGSESALDAWALVTDAEASIAEQAGDAVRAGALRDRIAAVHPAATRLATDPGR